MQIAEIMAYLQLEHLFLCLVEGLSVHIDLSDAVGVGIANVGFGREEHRATSQVSAQRRVVSLPRGRTKLSKVTLRDRIESTNAIHQRTADTRCGVGILVLGLTGQAAQCCSRVIHTSLLL